MNSLLTSIVSKINEGDRYFNIREQYGLKMVSSIIVLIPLVFYIFYIYNNKFSKLLPVLVGDIVTVATIFIPVLIIVIIAITKNRKLEISQDSLIIWKTKIFSHSIKQIEINKIDLQSISVYFRRFGSKKKLVSRQRPSLRVVFVFKDNHEYTVMMNEGYIFEFIQDLRKNNYNNVNQFVGNDLKTVY